MPGVAPRAPDPDRSGPMKLLAPLLVLPALACAGPGGHAHADLDAVTIHPIEHATLALTTADTTVYVDPVGGAERFAGLPAPDLILVTDVHGDHMDPETLAALGGADALVLAPRAVVDELGYGEVLGYGDTWTQVGTEGVFTVTGVAAYNLTEERLRYHPKGRGNGFVLLLGGLRVYLSGDTEDVPEMRALEGIDLALVCMNLPYTMTVDQAADGVLAFAPRVVVPYHHRGSDLDRFEQLVTTGNPGIEVRRLDWYPGD